MAGVVLKFQSTPPRGGATARAYEKALEGVISIHAPARGGDAAYQLKIDALEISIHAPARGGATHQLRTDLSHQGISIHAPARGGDHHGVHLVHRGRIISIHAPARGATCPASIHSIHHGISIHAPARGATIVLGVVRKFGIFQSTPPRGGRPTAAPALWAL